MRTQEAYIQSTGSHDPATSQIPNFSTHIFIVRSISFVRGYAGTNFLEAPKTGGYRLSDIFHLPAHASRNFEVKPGFLARACLADCCSYL